MIERIRVKCKEKKVHAVFRRIKNNDYLVLLDNSRKGLFPFVFIYRSLLLLLVVVVVVCHGAAILVYLS